MGGRRQGQDSGARTRKLGLTGHLQANEALYLRSDGKLSFGVQTCTDTCMHIYTHINTHRRETKRINTEANSWLG